MQQLGSELSKLLPRGSLVTLSGELGAGKSVLVRSTIHGFGYRGRVKSPTYTLIETYSVPETNHEQAGLQLAHLDLYRLTDPDELEYLGFDDVLSNHDVVFIEWPEQGADRLPEAALHVTISYGEGDTRQVSFSDPAENA